MKNIKDYLDNCSAYMFIGGLEDNFSDEKKLEENILLFFRGIEMLPQIKNQVDCDCPKVANKNNYTIDLVIKAEDGYLPIELKHSGSVTKAEIEEDIFKLEFYTQHYLDMPYGLLIYYSDMKDDPLAKGLCPSPVIDKNRRRFYYLLVGKNKIEGNNQNPISFNQRWDAKEM